MKKISLAYGYSLFDYYWGNNDKDPLCDHINFFVFLI